MIQIDRNGGAVCMNAIIFYGSVEKFVIGILSRPFSLSFFCFVLVLLCLNDFWVRISQPQRQIDGRTK